MKAKWMVMARMGHWSFYILCNYSAHDAKVVVIMELRRRECTYKMVLADGQGAGQHSGNPL
jgi:hypothetical protein